MEEAIWNMRLLSFDAVSECFKIFCKDWEACQKIKDVFFLNIPSRNNASQDANYVFFKGTPLTSKARQNVNIWQEPISGNIVRRSGKSQIGVDHLLLLIHYPHFYLNIRNPHFASSCSNIVETKGENERKSTLWWNQE